VIVLNDFDSPILPKKLFLLDPRIAFLNHGSFGATPRPVFEKYQWWQREMERQPVEFLSSTRRFNGLMREARESLAAYLHTDPNNIVYVPNATTGLNIVARSLEFGPGDEVLTTDHEYGALDRTWRFLGQKNGVMLRRQPLAQMAAIFKPFLDTMAPVYRHQAIPLPVTTHEDFVEELWKGVNERTRVIFLSHITSPTALIFPVKEICRRARQAGILTIVDGAHAVGQIPLDLDELGADFVSSNLHKWALAPKGAAFLYARPDKQHLVEPLVVSWGYESERPGPSRFIDEQEWTGTRDYSAYLAVPAALQFMEEHDWGAVRQYCHSLAQQARERICDLTGLAPISPDSTDWYMQMVTLPLPPCNSDELKRRLYDEFQVEVPIVTWQEKPFIRISIQAYNTSEDLDRLVSALRHLLCR
jgi:isopenicillin-N epimerase